jgi:(S)-2-hydroxy-acid oxidase
MGLSSYATYPLEDVIAQGLDNPYAMQMCVLKDRSITIQLLERAESMYMIIYFMTGVCELI